MTDSGKKRFGIRSGQALRRNASGQAMIFFLLVLVILVFVVLCNVDVHKILHLKAMTQNAGDSSALMAARWQGITLNLIGDLNIMHAGALSLEDDFAVEAITNVQARLCYVGPMIALAASQQAAKNNGMYSNDAFVNRMIAHANRVQNDYPHMTDNGGEMMFPEPYTGAWEDYAGMIRAVANSGVAAGPDNAALYTDVAGGHTLFNPGFYDAIAGSSWCWFFRNDYSLLQNYMNYHGWDPIPEILPHKQYINSEIFGLGLSKEYTSLSGFTGDPDAFLSFMNDIANDRGIPPVAFTNALDTDSFWFCYQSDAWSDWSVMDTEGPDRFPLTGPVKNEYDYSGADAASRVYARGLTLITPDQAAPDVIWSAAAKPFGTLNDTERPNSYALVLPAYRQVAMIPVDACSGPAGGAYNIDWREHIEQHLDDYMSQGPNAGVPGCYYCDQLTTWEVQSFRQAGVVWLSSNSYLCTLPTSGGHHRSGGTRRGH